MARGGRGKRTCVMREEEEREDLFPFYVCVTRMNSFSNRIISPNHNSTTRPQEPLLRNLFILGFTKQPQVRLKLQNRFLFEDKTPNQNTNSPLLRTTCLGRFTPKQPEDRDNAASNNKTRSKLASTIAAALYENFLYLHKI